MRSILPLFAAALATSAPVLATEVVPVPQFRSVELRGGGDIVVVPGAVQRVTIVEGSSQYTRMYVESDGQLKIDSCRSQCPHDYRLRIQIQSPHVPALAVSGGGAIDASNGFAPQDELAVAVHGGGKVDARAVPASHVSAAVNGGGELLVYPRTALAAAVEGGGAIRYWGNPEVTEAVMGGGAVLRGN